jgi:hypothetical protein
MRKVCLPLIAASAAFFSPIVFGADITLLSGFASWHQNRCKTVQAEPQALGGSSVVGAPWVGSTSRECLNQNNVGIGLRIDGGEWKNYAFGIYQNSYNRPSIYLAKEFTTHIVGPIHAGVLVGLVTGYKHPVTPWLVPELVLKFDPYEVALLASPFGQDRAAALQIRYTFK